jgi:hypothetical protein
MQILDQVPGPMEIDAAHLACLLRMVHGETERAVIGFLPNDWASRGTAPN